LSLETASRHLAKWGREKDIRLLGVSTATVPQAAVALGVIPARIAKSISLKSGDPAGESAFIVVTAGDTRLDNAAFKKEFGLKAKMLTPEEALLFTGHAVGGVCPFGLPEGIEVYLDRSLERFETVFPACGTGNSAIELTCAELGEYSLCKRWVSVCRLIEGE
jgi:prolyl-tRNA editing enzyme YbaK/EbsC (Cys-tRNA(Pro) deacylase)